ncbi:amine oxidase [flavin-containing] A isoform X2 [Diachasmimorpha longicaudata]|uniref:amine oxidase [flavin-containing] A isoform X2 n=1 Tax=Diachasmimorpha longicaudata TaxID=58733 RepID=UPI0030B88379
MNFPRGDDALDTDQDDFDVIIIGGGLTGLSAAYHLARKRANLSVMIIEATDSLGGRLKSGEHFHLFVHTFQNNMTQLLREMKIETEAGEQCDDKNRVFCDENGPVRSLPSFLAAQVYYCMKSLNESSLDERLESSENNEEFRILAELSAVDLINRMVVSPKAKSICASLISLTCGFTELNNISALWLLTVFHRAGGFFQRLKFFLNSNSRYFIKGGNSILLQRLTKRILDENVTINCLETANKITFDEYRKFVSTNAQTYKCSYVIVAISPPRSGQLTLESFPENYEKSQSCYVSTRLIRFESNYRNNFWHPDHSGTIVPLLSNGPSQLKLIQDTTHPPGNEIKTLSGYFWASDADNELSRSLQLSRTLRQCFNHIAEHSHVNFYEEVETKGLMSVLTPSSIQNHVNLLRTPCRRVFFAASEYSGRWPGTADGAVEAGEHAACLVLNDVRPQTLTRSQIVKFIPAKPRTRESSFEVWMTTTVLLFANFMIFWPFCRKAYGF